MVSTSTLTPTNLTFVNGTIQGSKGKYICIHIMVKFFDQRFSGLDYTDRAVQSRPAIVQHDVGGISPQEHQDIECRGETVHFLAVSPLHSIFCKCIMYRSVNDNLELLYNIGLYNLFSRRQNFRL